MEMNIGERTAQIQLLSKENNLVRIRVDDRIYEVDLVIADNGICSLIHNGHSFDMELTRSDNGRSYTVSQGFNTYKIEVVDTLEKYMRSRRKDELRQEDTIVAPMPGKIVKILVSPGDQLHEGQTLIVFEAMKMQSNLNVVGDCTVREILVSEGDSVASGQMLVKLETETNAKDHE